MKICFYFFLLPVFCINYSATGTKVPEEILKKLLPNNPIIVEAGAQFGQHTLMLSSGWPEATIYAFEPNPTSYEILKKNVALRTNITIYPLAFSDTIGEATFYVAGGASSLLRPTDLFNQQYFHADLSRPIAVVCTTLNAWVEEHAIPKIDLLWLVVEGHELQVLKAAGSILKHTSVLYLEVNFQEIWNGAVHYKELKRWLENEGFSEVWKSATTNIHGNVVFVRADS